MKQEIIVSLVVILIAMLPHIGCGAWPNAEDSCGFFQNLFGQRVSWKHTNADIYIDTSVPAQYIPVIQSAVSAWNTKLSRPALILHTTPVTVGPLKKDGWNVVYWDTSWTDKTTTQALTTNSWVNNRMVEADININAQYFSYSTNPSAAQVDLESLMIHELGHALGLDHQDSYSSVMYQYLANSQIRRTPSSEDIQRTKCEY